MRSFRSALVTGGAGFIGSHLADHLIDRGYSVTVLDNLATGRASDVPAAARFIEGDVRNQGDVDRAFSDGVDVVCHLAGQASIRRAWDDPGDDLSVNVLGTLNIIAGCRRHGARRLLYASSMTVYGNPTTIPTSETAAIAPVSCYGITKFAGERYAMLAGAEGSPTLDVTAFRMFNVYGPRQSLTNPYQGVLAIFLGNVLRDEPVSIHSDGEQSRDFVFVHDVCRAWCDALPNPATVGRVFNLGSGRDTTVNALCDAVLARAGRRRDTYPIHTAPAQPGDIRRSVADVSAIAEVLDWSPRVTLEQGMGETVDWARGEAGASDP
jgi:UDP-glucose 4-epimerase